MKKNIITVITTIAVFIIVFLLSFDMDLFSSTPKEKVFEKAGMRITLNDDFSEKEMVSQTAYYLSDDSIVVALKEEFTLFEEQGYPSDFTLEEYAELVMQNNNVELDILHKDNLTYFIYEKMNNGKNFTYYATVFIGKDAYWLIQFACETDNYQNKEKDFVSWAKGIEFY